MWFAIHKSKRKQTQKSKLTQMTNEISTVCYLPSREHTNGQKRRKMHRVKLMGKCLTSVVNLMVVNKSYVYFGRERTIA